MTDDMSLTTREVAERLGCSVWTIRRYVVRGELTPVRQLPGGTGALLFARADVEALCDARKPGGEAA
jgi:excisionase family DNA binding protein